MPIRKNDPIELYAPNTREPWLFRALQAYLLIITAHPFTDGNGRVSRILFNTYMRVALDNGFLPVADILRGSQGLYEELLALAAVDGEYDKLLSYLLALFEEYSKFILQHDFVSESIDEFRFAIQKSEIRNAHTDCEFDLHALPYVISYRSLLASAERPRNDVLLQVLAEVVNDLYMIAIALYAVCGLSHLRSNTKNEAVPLLLVVKALDVDRLLISSRALKSRYMKQVTLCIALETDHAVGNAKLLLGFCLSKSAAAARDTTLISEIHALPPAN